MLLRTDILEKTVVGCPSPKQTTLSGQLLNTTSDKVAEISVMRGGVVNQLVKRIDVCDIR